MLALITGFEAKDADVAHVERPAADLPVGKAHRQVVDARAIVVPDDITRAYTESAGQVMQGIGAIRAFGVYLNRFETLAGANKRLGLHEIAHHAIRVERIIP